VAQDGPLHRPVPATKLIPEAVAFIAVCTKAGKFTSASRIGGLFLNAQDSNTVVAGHEETRVASDKNLFLTAGIGHSVYARYTPGDTLKEDLRSAFGLNNSYNSLVQRAHFLRSMALKDSSLTALEKISAQAVDSIALTTKYDHAAIGKIIDGCIKELTEAQAKLALNAKEYGTDAAALGTEMGTAIGALTALKEKFLAAPTAHTTLELGKSGAAGQQLAKLDCQGPGCKISLSGTASDTAGVFEAKMTNSGGAESSLELKNDSAQMKADKGGDASSLSLASKKATLASKETSLELDGAKKNVTLSAGDNTMKVLSNNGFSLTTNKSFSVTADNNVQLNAHQVSLLKGKIKFSDASIEAKASGSVSISAGMIKIG